MDSNIPTEVLAAYLDGNATAHETQMILDAMAEDAELNELMHISQCVDAELGMVGEELDILPMTAMAATCEESNYCCLECEKYILQQLGMDYDAESLFKDAVVNPKLVVNRPIEDMSPH